MSKNPVAYINVEERKLEWVKPTAWETPTIVASLEPIPLYTRCEWVGLTDEELHDLQIEHIDDPWANFKAIEAKLKEKNT